ncbi:MAG: hypothetical protein K0U52_00670 [Gammaproteobacteria bacterium]|nr:hypothetical protein [Gammaproteobacteria bacterium]
MTATTIINIKQLTINLSLGDDQSVGRLLGKGLVVDLGDVVSQYTSSDTSSDTTTTTTDSHTDSSSSDSESEDDVSNSRDETFRVTSIPHTQPTLRTANGEDAFIPQPQPTTTTTKTTTTTNNTESIPILRPPKSPTLQTVDGDDPFNMEESNAIEEEMKKLFSKVPKCMWDEEGKAWQKKRDKMFQRVDKDLRNGTTSVE